MFKYAIIESAPPENHSINYTKCRLNKSKDSLLIDYLSWNDWPGDFVFRDKLALVDLGNTAYDNYVNKQNMADRRIVALMCARKIAEYCKAHDIKAAFFGLKPGYLIDSLEATGIPARSSNVDINKEGWNCAPLDPGHPSAKAHNAYAIEVYNFIKTENLIQKY